MCLLAACGSAPGMREWAPTQSSPDALEERQQTALAEVRGTLERGDRALALARLDALCAERPDDIGLAAMRQETALASGVAIDELRAEYDRRVRERPSVATLLLSARIEADVALARERIDRALELGPRSAWAHYALAHLQTRESNWALAQKSLQRALELDPSHLAARRLEAALLVRNGRLEVAIRALELWLAAADRDLRVDPAARLSAELDLALLWVQAGEPRRARTILASLSGGEVDALRRLCVLAAAEESSGRARQALEAARAAEAVDPKRALPKVQQAMLYEQWLHDPDQARAAWQRVISSARSQGELSDLIQSMRARVVLERLDAEAARAQSAKRDLKP